jgi:hypothetical protein
MQSSSPWQTVSERLNRHVSQDPRLGRALLDVSKQLAQESKIAFRIDEGRQYALQADKYNMVLKKQLARQWKNPPVQNHW